MKKNQMKEDFEKSLELYIEGKQTAERLKEEWNRCSLNEESLRNICIEKG